MDHRYMSYHETDHLKTTYLRGKKKPQNYKMSKEILSGKKKKTSTVQAVY